MTEASAQPTLLYLEADDEITAVVRRVRAADPGRIVIVAPGRSRATSSAVALRLLAAEDREVAVVGDVLTRSLAAEAGLTAYASVDEARRAAPTEPEAAGARHAAIHVVRGSATDETAPTLAAGAVAATAATASSDAPTVSTPVMRPRDTRPGRASRPRPRPRPRAAPRRAVPVALVGVLALLLVGAVAAGAVLLPSAVIAVTPRSEPIAPRTDEIVVDDPEVLTGTVESTATVTPSGSYAIQEPATGTVVLLNWTFFPVEVPAGTFVAAGEQAFATQADITVPRGALTRDGRIAAGEEAVAVVAAAVGPAANVAAGAIDTVVSPEIDARLRGFPENPERRVTNPEATSGGVDTSGTEFVQADVDAAVASLREDLAAQAAAAVPDAGDEALVLTPDTLAEPAIQGVDGIVGTRDQDTVEIGGSQAWTAYRVDPEAVLERAEEQFLDDPDILPDGHRLLPEATSVTLGAARLERETVVVETRVSGRSAPELDPEAVRARVVGRTPEEARAALADLGTVEIHLWPGWVTSVPELEWRVEIRIEELEPAEPVPSGSAGESP